MRPTRLPSTMPCLWPRPERGMSTAARPGSPRWIAIPVGTRELSPGRSVIGSSMHARRSSPAEPWVAYAGSCDRILSSRIRMSSLFNSGNLLQRSDLRARPPLGELQRVRHDCVGDAGLGRAREGVGAMVVVDGDLVLF